MIVLHRPTGLKAEASERRSQSSNRSVALYRLRLRLAVEVRSPWTTESLSQVPVTSLWSRRLSKGRIRVSENHDDLPALISESLDHLARAAWKPAEAAERLSISVSQLIGLLRSHAPALQLLNQHRQTLGLRPLS